MNKKSIEVNNAEKIVFVYSSQKTASSTVNASLRRAGIYSLQVHNFFNTNISDTDIKGFVQRKSGKVISLVRDPVARQISLMWHNIGKIMGTEYGSFRNMEKEYFAIPNPRDEFEWYREEMESVLGLNVYDYPFDRELGYSIIKKEGVSVLLIKVEKLFALEKIIAEFLRADNYRLHSYNIGEKKIYKYAYKEYLSRVVIPEIYLEYYYHGNPYMEHFYTQEEIQNFYKR